MSLTSLRRPVVRVTAELSRGRPIVVRLEEGGKLIRFKEKGRRQWYTCTVKQAFWCAVQNRAAELRAEKLARRKARREAREGR